VTRLLRQERTGDRQVDQIGRNVELFARVARASPFWDGALVTATLSSTPTQVNHTLGRAYRGWLVVRLQATSAQGVFEPPGATQVSSQTSIPLQASGPCTVTLWVY
jgi:hypothetical protein